jgi:trehalose/maltose transport system permease protein
MSTVATPAPVPRKRRRRTKLQRRQTRLGWLLLVPSLAVVAFVAIYPLAKTVYQSFTNQEFLAGVTPTKWVGIDNYRTLWHDTIFRDTVVLTIKFTAITVGFEFVLGLIIALVVNSSFKGRGVMRAVMLVPWAIPTVVAAQMWKWMLDDTFGVVNDLGMRIHWTLFGWHFHLISHPHAWISEPSTQLAAVSAVDIWKTTPFVALLLLAGLQVIPGDLYEAASVDGANKLQQFWRITLPLLRPAILVTLIFRTLDALRVFDVFQVFFGYRLGAQSMAVYDQSTTVNDGHVGYGASMSVAIFLIISLFVVIYVTFMRVTEE